jgi:hypothetical protein
MPAALTTDFMSTGLQKVVERARNEPELPSRSRLWVEAVYQEERVGDRPAEARRKALAAEQTKKDAASFAPTALPKKPPGR